MPICGRNAMRCSSENNTNEIIFGKENLFRLYKRQTKGLKILFSYLIMAEM